MKFRIRKELKVNNDIGKIIAKRLQHKRLMVKLSFPKKECVGKCQVFQTRKSYVVFLKVKKSKRAIYDLSGVVEYRKGTKVC